MDSGIDIVVYRGARADPAQGLFSATRLKGADIQFQRAVEQAILGADFEYIDGFAAEIAAAAELGFDRWIDTAARITARP